MNAKRITRTSKRLSWLLRHGANETKLPMDAAGWVQRDALLRTLHISDEVLDHVVAHNNKSRIQVDGPRVRACQGHSLDGTPVTVEALESSWRAWTATEQLWHGTGLSAVEAIGVQGLLPQARSHVHLAQTLDSRVGKRAGVAVMLAVCPQRLAAAGLGVFVSPNGVVLVREVPADCIVGVVLCSNRARRSAEQLRAWLGLPAVVES